MSLDAKKREGKERVEGVSWDWVKKMLSRDLAGAFEGLRVRIMELLFEFEDRLGTCEAADCKRLYVRRRPHQRFCGTQCTQRVHTARFRQAHPRRRAVKR